MAHIHIVGGGLAGSEAAWQCLKGGHRVNMYEMRPLRQTEAHQTQGLAELVCSNSMKSLDPNSAPGMLKYELGKMGSLILEGAEFAQVPAGKALAVDRVELSQYVEKSLHSHPNFKLVRQEIVSIEDQASLAQKDQYWVVATGPLTSPDLAGNLLKYLNAEANLYFYDAIAPIVDFDSIDHGISFRADRYGEAGEGDYLNLPFEKDEYYAFIDAVLEAEKTPCHEFEKPQYFECCLPIEVMIERGRNTLRFGPMKPVGLTDPRTQRRPYAVIQLRAENKAASAYSMVGFQTKMKWPEQSRIFREFVPALKDAEFHRFGSVHRNTYINGPKALNKDLSLRGNNRIFMAGQITGVEGYLESTAIGAMVGLAADARITARQFSAPPPESMLGALMQHVTASDAKHYQPMNCNMGIIPQPPFQGKKLPKAERRLIMAERGRLSFDQYWPPVAKGLELLIENRSEPQVSL
jgi:methylenetetrahydrofolate--tRNA-(uracil-5-)-methyltransferase